MSDIESEIDTTTDDFLGGAVRLQQPRRGYRAGTDSVLLAAAFVPSQQKDRSTPPNLADIGAGVGTVGLCVKARLPEIRLTSVERNPRLASLCRANHRANLAADDPSVVISADLRGNDFKADMPSETAADVIANPPFYDRDASSLSHEATRAESSAWEPDDLELWARTMTRILKPGGSVTLIHPVTTLSAWLAAFRNRLGDIQVVPVHAHASKSAIRFLLRAVKGSRAGLTLCPPLILHAENSHGFCAPVDRVLRAPQHLDVWRPGP